MQRFKDHLFASVYEEQKQLKNEFEIAQNEKIKKEVTRLKKTAAEKAEWSRSREGDKTKKSVGFIDTENRRVNRGAIGADAARTMKRSKAIVNRMETQIGEKEKLLKDIEYVEPLTMNVKKTHHKRLLTVENLQLRYQQLLFSPVNFTIDQNECVALTGANGIGKSTIIHYLLDDFDGITAGTIHKPNQLTISYVRQNYEDNRGTLSEFAEKQKVDYQTFLNNLRKLGMEREVFHNRIEQMSMGQRKKVELAKSLSQEAELYIWDEPLNYLDVFNQVQLEQLILSFKPAMLVVDHDQVFLNKIADRLISCIFAYIYFARTDSRIDGVEVYHSRILAGKALAESYPVEADLVVGAPYYKNSYHRQRCCHESDHHSCRSFVSCPGRSSCLRRIVCSAA